MLLLQANIREARCNLEGSASRLLLNALMIRDDAVKIESLARLVECMAIDKAKDDDTKPAQNS